jgi:hypothetical protein
LRTSIVIQDDRKAKTLLTQQGLTDARIKGRDVVPPLNATKIGHTIDKENRREQDTTAEETADLHRSMKTLFLNVRSASRPDVRKSACAGCQVPKQLNEEVICRSRYGSLHSKESQERGSLGTQQERGCCRGHWSKQRCLRPCHGSGG